MNVLVAENNSETAMLLQNALEVLRFKVCIAHDGIDAYEQLKLQDYAFVFLEHDLPEISGLELVKWMKKNGYKSKIVLMTAYPNVDEVFAKAVGVDEFIRKPFMIATILDIIRPGSKAA